MRLIKTEVGNVFLMDEKTMRSNKTMVKKIFSWEEGDYDVNQNGFKGCLLRIHEEFFYPPRELERDG